MTVVDPLGPVQRQHRQLLHVDAGPIDDHPAVFK